MPVKKSSWILKQKQKLSDFIHISLVLKESWNQRIRLWQRRAVLKFQSRHWKILWFILKEDKGAAMKSQTLNLLKKEIKLGNSTQSICWTICCFGMYLIPSYPYYVGPFYITLAIMMTFALNQSSHDILYTVLFYL